MQWEHKFVKHLEIGKSDKVDWTMVAENYLNNLGKEGWEVVNFVVTEVNEYEQKLTILMKRPKK